MCNGVNIDVKDIKRPDRISDINNVPFLSDSASTLGDSMFSREHKQGRQLRRKEHVQFSYIEIHEHNITIGDNPWCSEGVPISLDWEYNVKDQIDIDYYEATRPKRRNRRDVIMNSFKRRDKLWKFGHTIEEIEQAIKEVDVDRRRKMLNIYFLPLFRVEEMVTLTASNIGDIYTRTMRGRYNKKGENGKRHVSNSSSTSNKNSESDNDIESCLFEINDAGSLSQISHISDNWSLGWRNSRPNSQLSINTHGTTEEDDENNNNDDRNEDELYVASQNSKFNRYHVKVDHKQHDKSTEIILCRADRPHMRAFHASWFSFFVAFFTWFSITPLLGQIKSSLALSKSDIWTSSLCGTAGTIIMRIAMGPACDRFGARLCMVFVLVAAAVPTALTGLVQTSTDLFVLRTFIGIAGSSFVACQYWTSSMFTREVAGTANALVAGWGNLGGGVAQLIMGSVLFPLFKYIYKGGDGDVYDDVGGADSAELAWRTIFVVPAVLSLLMAFFCLSYCDDCPKGDYRSRMRHEMTIVDPCTSLSSAFQNWNVLILAVQYACCFGVEVTMTNASALYFEEEFDLTTEAAAAIASIFGIMNLFARGIGGYGSDALNIKYGFRGRRAWQFVTLLIQAIGIIVFSYSKGLAGAILALVFTSLFVQSAEGSTFGIVPYVDRRFTGAAVGLIGAGGNVGGVIFAVFFREYSYQKAFMLMGVAAGVSSLLSFLINTNKLINPAMESKDDTPVTIGMTRRT